MNVPIRKAVLGAVAGLSTIALVSACASAPEEPAGEASAKKDFLPCMVSDSGGFDDNSFNQISFEGFKEAAKELGVETKQAESNTETDFANNISSMVDANCNLVIGVGFLMADAMAEAAAANSDVNFAIVDVADVEATNEKSIIFDTVGAAFLAGYAAADTSKTGVVATFGGMKIPSVSIFMDGFAEGVEYYNQQKSASVKVLGWDVAKQDGQFTGGFEANETAKSLAQGLIDQNADVIMPVGGPIFQSAAAAITDSKKDIALIGVDADLYNSAPQFKSMYLTSVLKGIGVGVKQVVLDAGNDKFSNEPYIGTLENDGVGIAPFHDWESKVKPTLQDELDTIKAGLIDGSIKATSVSSPKVS